MTDSTLLRRYVVLYFRLPVRTSDEFVANRLGKMLVNRDSKFVVSLSFVYLVK